MILFSLQLEKNFAQQFFYETFYNVKIVLKILDILSESGFVLQFFEVTINLTPMGVFCILYICGRRLWAQVTHNQSINQSNIIYFTIHKCLLKNLQDHLGNKVVFIQMER